MLYSVYRSYYDGKNANDNVYVIDESNIEAFSEFLLGCGYVKTSDFSFERRYDPGFLDHHGDHSDTVWFSPYEGKTVLTESTWKEKFFPFDDNFEKVSPGYYRYIYDPDGLEWS